MKITIGSGAPVPEAQFQEKIWKVLNNAMEDKALEAGDTYLKRLKTIVEEVATLEADRMFDVVADLISRPNARGLTFSDLYAFSSPSLQGGFKPTGGSIQWADLSYKYIVQKVKSHPESRYYMFRYTGRLQNYLTRSGPNIVESRLGGVKVTIEKQGWRNKFALQSPEDAKKFLLGNVQLKIFPRMNASLMPMLKTGQWTSTNNGAFEANVFAGTKASYKMTNGGRPYRPLVLPVAQFFMQTQIPNAVIRRLKSYFGKTAFGAGG